MDHEDFIVDFIELRRASLDVPSGDDNSRRRPSSAPHDQHRKQTFLGPSGPREPSSKDRTPSAPPSGSLRPPPTTSSQSSPTSSPTKQTWEDPAATEPVHFSGPALENSLERVSVILEEAENLVDSGHSRHHRRISAGLIGLHFATLGLLPTGPILAWHMGKGTRKGLED